MVDRDPQRHRLPRVLLSAGPRDAAILGALLGLLAALFALALPGALLACAAVVVGQGGRMLFVGGR